MIGCLAAALAGAEEGAASDADYISCRVPLPQVKCLPSAPLDPSVPCDVSGALKPVEVLASNTGGLSWFGKDRSKRPQPEWRDASAERAANARACRIRRRARCVAARTLRTCSSQRLKAVKGACTS